MDLIAVVTGASRGAGKGIAIALGEAGATVYVTGRSVADSDSLYGGTVSETADLVTQAGGNGVAIALDHTDDKAVAALFERVKAEHGRLDILVNNAAKLVGAPSPGGFWEKPLEAVDLITVGLRSHFVAAYYAAPLLIANGRGLIVNTPTTGASPITPPVRHMARRRLAPTRWLQIWPRNFVRTMLRRFRSGWVPSILNVHARTLLLSRKTRSPSSDENHHNAPEGSSLRSTRRTRV